MTISRTSGQASAVVAKYGGPVHAGAPLVVGPDETAVFARGGEVIRLVEAGSYQVPGEFAGDGVEVCFVRTRPISGAKFGGPAPRMAGSSARMVFGTFSYRVTSPALLIGALLGGNADDEALEKFVTSELMRALAAALEQHGADPSGHAAVAAATLAGASGLGRYGLALVALESMTAR